MKRLLIALSALVFISVSALAQAAEPYSLAGYHLTEPVNKAGELSGKARQIEPAELTRGYTSEWFLRGDDTFTFVTPDGGAVTDTAKYARTELRAKKEWKYTQRMTHKVRLRVLVLPEGEKVIVHQFHDKKIPWVKTTAEIKGGTLRVRNLVKTDDAGKKEVSLEMVSGLKLGDTIVSQIDWFPPKDGKAGYIRVNVNGVEKRQAAVHTGAGGGVYAKAGSYCQILGRKGRRCVVQHF